MFIIAKLNGNVINPFNKSLLESQYLDVYLFYNTLLCLNCQGVYSVDDYWIDKEFHSYSNLEVSYTFQRVPTSIWLLVKVCKILLYSFIWFDHFYMVITCPIDELGWRFPEIANLEIIPYETLSHPYT